ncbi:MAG: hypothetical protein AAFV72_16195 [Cyanobacteria bacterium J06635_1]
MNETDMELQAIRQKLQSLKAEPAPDEALAIPWSQPRAHLPAPSHPPSKSGPDLAQVQVDAAIEALKQRSSQPYGDPRDSRAEGDRDDRHAAHRHAAQRYGAPTGTPLDQVLQHFESQLQKVNSLAEQQESAILGLKQLADHVADIISQQGIDDHPKLAAIAALFEAYPSTVIPTIECDRAGNYGLGYRTVDFYRAEHDAQLTAQTLRSRVSAEPGDQPPETDLPTYFNQSPSQGLPGKPTGFFEEGLLFLQSIWELTLSSFNPGAGASRQRTRPRFTLLDAAIWFSGAAITRILLDVIFQIYPVLWTPLVVTLIGVVAVTLYRTLLSNRPSLGFSYRILVALAGLLMGGQFL